MKFLESVIPDYHVCTKTYGRASEDRVEGTCPLMLAMEEMVSWDLVTDEILSDALQDVADSLEDGHEEGFIGGKENSARRRRHASIKRRRRNCGFDMVNSSDVHVQVQVREGEKIWSLLGIAMVAEVVLASLTSPGQDRFSSSSSSFSSSFSSSSATGRSGVDTVPLTAYRSLISRIYSPKYIWHTFYPMLFPLLRSSPLATTEGLSLACQLGEVFLPLFSVIKF